MLLALVNLGAPATVSAQAVDAAPRARLAGADRPEDRKAIEGVAEMFTRAYNAGDAKAVAALFAEDAEMIDEEGERLDGRPVIEAFYAALFRQRPGAKIGISMESLRFLGADAAKEEGRTTVKPAGVESPTVRRYNVLFSKQHGGWLYSSVREEFALGTTPHEHLMALEWLVGEWVDESSDSTVHAKCRWSDDKNFLLREFTIHVQGKPIMTVTQRIGWDPVHKQVKSWVFDSEGGFGDALWAQNGNQWTMKSHGTLPDGKTATATNILTRIGPNQARWLSHERTVGGQSVPESAEYVMVRKPPGPLSK
jgi:uncharacterized protein (TIGR02246 family)